MNYQVMIVLPGALYVSRAIIADAPASVKALIYVAVNAKSRKMVNTEWNVKDSSKSPAWLLAIFSTFFDPCPLNDNPTIDGLKIPWKAFNYVNPPYSDKKPWILKAIDEMKKGNTTVMLLPHVPDAAWFFDLIVPNAEILGFRGRLELDNGKHPKYGSMLVVFHPKVTKNHE